MLKSTVKVLFNNYYLIFGIIIGLFLNFSFIELDCTQKATFIPDFNYSTLKAVIKNNVTRSATSKNVPVRPRYYSTELGIKEKLFIGVFTSEEKLQSQTIHVNKTLQHVVQQVKYFMTAAPSSKRRNNPYYSGLIGFTEGKPSHRPFQVIKYICDNFLQDYDYYFLMNDFNYLDVRKLKGVVEKISVSKEVYTGSVVKDGSYCNIDAGILFSNSVIRAMKQHIEWCVLNAVTSDNSENIGRCVYYATKLECQEGLNVPSYKLKSFDLEKKFKDLQINQEFNAAVTVYPIINKEDFYLLHSHYSKLHLNRLKDEINDLSKDLTEHWPPGERKGSVPATRFDLPNKFYFNRTHVFAPDDFTTVRRHKRIEQLDIDYILQAITKKFNENQNGDEMFELLELINGYRTFDMSRGLDYIFDLKFVDKSSKKLVNKRFEVCKPIGTAEFIPAPYVTENSKVTILLPIEETEVEATLKFLQRFDVNILDKKEKVLLMLVFFYQSETPSKGPDDVFGPIKDAAIRYSNKYKSEDTKVAWVSIRLPQPVKSESFVSKQTYNVLNFVAIDLALKKVGVESLLLFLTPFADLQTDFLNRVRMNTVINFQVFSVIPFRFYNPALVEYEQLEINKMNGHFDAESYDFVAFYGRDYVAARKKSKHLVPLTRVDNDIVNILDDVYKTRGNVFKMFVEYSNGLHCLRAPDMSLKMLYKDEMVDSRKNWFLATKTQLAKVILANSDNNNY